MLVVARRARRTGSSPTGFLPEIDEGAFVLDYFTPGGTALAETDRQVHIVEQILRRDAGGRRAPRGAPAPSSGCSPREQNRGDMVVRLKPRERAQPRRADEVIDDVRGKIAAAVPRLRIEFVQILSDVINDLAGAARPVEIKLFGADLDALEAYAKQLEPKLSKVDGIEDLFNGVSEPSAELTMTHQQAEANRVGLTPDQVGDRGERRAARRPGGRGAARGSLDRRARARAGLGALRSAAARRAADRHRRRRTPRRRSARWRPSSRRRRAPSCCARTSSR